MTLLLCPLTYLRILLPAWAEPFANAPGIASDAARVNNILLGGSSHSLGQAFKLAAKAPGLVWPFALLIVFCRPAWWPAEMQHTCGMGTVYLHDGLLPHATLIAHSALRLT